MLMNRLAAQQEFLPTDLIQETPFWYFVVSALLILVGILGLIPAKNSKEEEGSVRGGVGGALLLLGVVVLGVSLFVGDIPDSKQNHENLQANVKTAYNVDDVTLIEFPLENGSRVNIVSDGLTSEVIVNWDPDTYEPTLSPISVDLEDLEALKRK